MVYAGGDPPTRAATCASTLGGHIKRFLHRRKRANERRRALLKLPMAVRWLLRVAPSSGPTRLERSWLAPQKPVQAFGGFIQLGLPLSRWFNANPQGHNAGWQLHFTIGKDQVVHSDQDRANGVGCAAADGSAKCNGGLPMSMGKSAIGTLYYKFNNWCSFGFEQSVYRDAWIRPHPALHNCRTAHPTNGRITVPNSGRSSHSRPTFHPSGPNWVRRGFPVGSLRRPVHTEGTRPQKRRRTVSIRAMARR